MGNFAIWARFPLEGDALTIEMEEKNLGWDIIEDNQEIGFHIGLNYGYKYATAGGQDDQRSSDCKPHEMHLEWLSIINDDYGH